MVGTTYLNINIVDFSKRGYLSRFILHNYWDMVVVINLKNNCKRTLTTSAETAPTPTNLPFMIK